MTHHKIKIILTLLSGLAVSMANGQRVGIGTTTPKALLHVNDSSVLFSGLNYLPASSVPPPVSGKGTRTFWYVQKAAFRTGGVYNTSVYGLPDADTSGYHNWDMDSIGVFSFAAGLNTKAKAEYSTAFGRQSAATGAIAAAFGNQSIASGTASFAAGIGAKATASATVAFGSYTQASGANSIAAGESTLSSGISATALGGATIASGNYSFAAGESAKSSGEASTAMGTNTTASGINSMAIGNQSVASGDYSVSMGDNCKSLGNFSIGMGEQSVASADYSVAIGTSAKAQTYGAFAIGNSTTASGTYSTAMGNASIASGDYSTATGKGNIAMGYGSFVAGSGSKANGAFSTAMGMQTTAGGDRSTSMGDNTSASGNYSTALGSLSVASGAYATAIGKGNKAVGYAAFAAGVNSTANGVNSTSLGVNANTDLHVNSFCIGGSNTSTVNSADNQMMMRFDNYTFWISNSNYAYLVPASNGWAYTSDRTKKEKFEELNGETVLQKIADIPFYSWNFKANDTKQYRHYGIMAQDFYQAFGKDKYGSIGNDTTVSPLDLLGVAYSGIKALEKRTADLQIQNNQMAEEITTLKALLVEVQAIKGKMAALKPRATR